MNYNIGGLWGNTLNTHNTQRFEVKIEKTVPKAIDFLILNLITFYDSKLKFTKFPPLLLPNPTIPLRRYSVVPQHGGAVRDPTFLLVNRFCERPAVAQPDSARALVPGNVSQPNRADQRHRPQRPCDQAPGIYNDPAHPFDRGYGLRRERILGCVLEAYGPRCYTFYCCPADHAWYVYAKFNNHPLAPPLYHFQ